MIRYYTAICAAALALVLLFLTSCSLFIPDDRFDGGRLMDSEELSLIKSEIFATEADTEVETEPKVNADNVTKPDPENENTAVAPESAVGNITEAIDTPDFTEEATAVLTENKEEFESNLSQTEEIITESKSEGDNDKSNTESDESPDESNIETESETETKLMETVYWTKGGEVWHLFKDCGHLKNSKSILSGSVEDAIENGKEKVCSACSKRQEP